MGLFTIMVVLSRLDSDLAADLKSQKICDQDRDTHLGPIALEIAFAS